MGERELILILAATLFFTMTSMSINKFCMMNNEEIMQSQINYNGLSIAQGFIEEAKTRYFDVAAESGPVSNPNNFTGYPLGPRYDEHYPNFTDVDDYNNLNTNVQMEGMNFDVQVTVFYVDENNLDTKVYYKTRHKKMIVTVTNDYLSQDITLSHVFSYYDFN